MLLPLDYPSPATPLHLAIGSILTAWWTKFIVAKAGDILTFEKDAVKNPELCTISGALADIKNVLTEARQAWSEKGEPPGTVFLSLQYPNSPKAHSLLKMIQQFNKLMNPTTVGQKLLLKAFRTASRIKGSIPEVEATPMPNNLSRILVKIDLSGVEASDLDKAEKFLGNRQLLRLAEKLHG